MRIDGSPAAQWYARFAAAETGSSPTFQRWALAVAADEELAARIDALPHRKRQPNLVFAAARRLGAVPGDVQSLKATVLGEWEAVEEIVMTRQTQTNEPRRCATILPALSGIEGPVALIEVGASAGLNLLLDRYSYRYSDGRTLDPDDGPSPVVFSCDVEGSVPLPPRMPEVVWRGGLDLNPLSVHSDDDMDWLEQLIWPEHDDRREHFRRAVVIGRNTELQLVAGDAVEDLPDLVASAPSDATVVVMHSAVLAYLTADDRQRFGTMVRGLDVHWIAQEGAGAIPTDAPLPPSPRPGWFCQTLDGVPTAAVEPHGTGIRWW